MLFLTSLINYFECYMSDFNEMIERFSAKSTKKINRLCEPLFKSFGVNYFVHQSITEDGQFCAIGTHPDLMFHYIEEEMYKYNPFITNFQKCETGSYLYDSVDNHTFQENMVMLENKFDIKHSCIIMEKQVDRCNQYAFAIPCNNKFSSDLLINNKTLLHRFILFFQVELADTLKELRKDPVSLPGIIGPSFRKKIGVPKVCLENSEKLNFLSQIKDQDYLLLHIKFSKREIDCLREFYKHKIAREIATELGLSVRTVQHYLENIKNKLACESKTDLFVNLKKMEILNIYPEIFKDRYG